MVSVAMDANATYDDIVLAPTDGSAAAAAVKLSRSKQKLVHANISSTERSERASTDVQNVLASSRTSARALLSSRRSARSSQPSSRQKRSIESAPSEESFTSRTEVLPFLSLAPSERWQKPPQMEHYPGEGFYNGALVNGKRHGLGKLWFASGDVFEGVWKNDKMVKGKLQSSSGLYDGDFVRGKRHGHGTQTYENGVFSGRWKADEKECGLFRWKDGTSYDGQFKDGVMHGEGTYTFSDGSTYKGHYDNGKRHGRGILTRTDNSHQVGEWWGNQFKRALSRKQYEKEPPAIMPQFVMKRDTEKERIEQLVQMETWAEEQLELQREGSTSPTGEDGWDWRENPYEA